MNQSLILAFILLATLSVGNALPHQLSKRETQWRTCEELGGEFPLLSVTISPDLLVQGQDDTFSVSEYFEADSTSILGVGFYTDFAHQPLHTFQTRVCRYEGLPNCPINPFKMDYKITVPTGLPNPYFLAVVVGNLDLTIFGCAATQVGGGSEESYPIASYPIASYPIASYPIAE
ncbi:hypothetical protein Glove_259g39 [Diversispora epigaea]|uniref:MD-2-related lipid-recognition domain-containing protein n=1 Tax=Diversispora epigaea TaxID=1348612 RepID=A0A397IEY6_9GLOM|nr:hypothetical protein Glove_259g39 [Diversispora epigaea]